jgi:hypothetical protein
LIITLGCATAPHQRSASASVAASSSAVSGDTSTLTQPSHRSLCRQTGSSRAAASRTSAITSRS